MKLIKAVLFDFRDTLLDVSESRGATNLLVYEFCREKGAQVTPEEFQRSLNAAAAKIIAKFQRDTSIHNWAMLIVSQLLADLSVKFDGKEFERLMQKHGEVFIDKAKLFPDVLPLFKLLEFKSVKMGVIIDGTSKREWAIIKKLDLENFFDVVIISEEVGKNKLSIVPLESALAKLQLPPGNVVVVGDRIDKDIEPANKLGCVSVKLERKGSRFIGQQPKSEHGKPRHVISKLTELAEIV